MHDLRKLFPILATKLQGKPLVFLDSASTTHKPQMVLDAMHRFYTTHNANVHRGVYTLAEQATMLYEQARQTVADFIGAGDASEIVFTSGTTESINAVAAVWGTEHIKAGDVIVITELEHHANLLPWQRLAKQQGAELRFIPVNADGTLDMSVLPSLLQANTKLVAVSHVSHVLGTHNDLETIISEAHAVGAKVLVDAAQSVPHQRINVQTTNADFVAFSGHKMVGPTGIGVLYINKRLHDELVPYKVGGGMVYEADFAAASWRAMPHMLEAGTPPIAQAVGLAAACDFLQTTVDFVALQKHEASLCAQLIDGLAQFDRIKILGPVESLKKQGHLVSFTVEGIHAHDVAAALNTSGICVRAGHQCAQPLAKKIGLESAVRASFYCYSTDAEVELLLFALKTMLQTW